VFRFVLFLILSIFVARAFWRILDGIIEGYSGRPPGSNVPTRGVQMARDPVCGTYVVPDRAVAITDGTRRVFFCSVGCRDRYRAKTG
jgi:hypothetical protein